MITTYVNARLIDKDKSVVTSLSTSEGKIIYVGDTPPRADVVVDVAYNALMPAFIDMHCHLRDPGFPQKETIETGMRAALAGGYGTLVAMANTSPVCSTPELVQANHMKAAELSLCNLIQSASAGQELEDKVPTDYEALSKVTRVITNDGKTIFSDEFMKQLLLASEKYGFIISTHCQPETKTVERDLKLLSEFGGNLHVGHISKADTVRLIKSFKRDYPSLKLTCEVTPHHLFGHDLDYRVNPPFRTEADVQMLIAAIKYGVVDCLATDHAPHTPQDKANGMAGISNIEYAFSVYSKVLGNSGISFSELSKLMSYNPAKLLGLNKGLLAEGYDADLVIADLSGEWNIYRDMMISRSHNTPFEGRSVRGRILRTIVGGQERYGNGQAL